MYSCSGFTPVTIPGRAAADNGTLFEWSIDFNPEIVPGVTTFTPVIGLGSDSSYWHPVGDLDNIVSTSDLGVVGVSDDANYVDLMFPDPGTFEFGYVVTNNFGCTWDTTLTVEVVENPGTIITAGPDQIFCSEPIQLLGGLDTGEPSACGVAGAFDYCYGANDNTIFSYCPDTPGDGTLMTLSFTAGQMEAGWDAVTVYDGPDATGPVLAILDATFAGQTFTASNPDGCISFQFSSDGGCDQRTQSTVYLYPPCKETSVRHSLFATWTRLGAHLSTSYASSACRLTLVSSDV